MSETDFESRTEEPTHRRREDARRRGQVAMSSDLQAGLVLLTGALCLWLTAETLGGHLSDAVREGVRRPFTGRWGTFESLVAARWMFGKVLLSCGVIVFTLNVLAGIVALMQVGPSVSTEPLGPNWEKLSPISGAGRLFSKDSIVRGLLAIVKVVLVLGVLAIGVQKYLTDGVVVTELTFDGLLMYGWDWVGWLLLIAAGGTALMGIADVVWQRRRNERQLRMTREEVKQEQKEDNGSPELKARIRKLQRDAASRRGLQEVPEATVVLTNPTHYAVALKYDASASDAPIVVAKGEGRFALRIREIAHQHGVEVLERKPLARALYRTVEVGDAIPAAFYQVIAEILAQVYRMKRGA